jgi:hypothetical protein
LVGEYDNSVHNPAHENDPMMELSNELVTTTGKVTATKTELLTAWKHGTPFGQRQQQFLQRPQSIMCRET